jgi:hypothetical protein
MTKSKRVGHWRTNAQGTTTWVTEHTLERTVYTLSKDGTNKLVNGQKLLETYCNYCYQKVFFVSLNEKKKYFNNNSEPLILHQCRIRDKKTTINKRPIKTKKFLDEKNVKALFRRVEELRKTSDKIKSQKKIKSDKAKALKEQKIARKKTETERLLRLEVLRIFYAPEGKKHNRRLSQLKVGHVNKYLPRIIYNEIKPFVLEQLNKDTPYANFKFTGKKVKNVRKRMQILFTNIEKYSEIKKLPKEVDIFSLKLSRLIEYLGKIVTSFSEAELLVNERKITSEKIEKEQIAYADKIKKEIKEKEAAKSKLRRLEANNAKLAANAAKVIVVKKKKFKNK